MANLHEFKRQYSNEFFDIRAKNNTKLFENQEIADFFFLDYVLTEIRGKQFNFEQLYTVISSDFQEMKGSKWYTYRDWSERSQKEFRRLCQEFYDALRTT